MNTKLQNFVLGNVVSILKKMNELFHLQLSMRRYLEITSKPESISKSAGVFLQKIIHIPVFIVVFNLIVYIFVYYL